MVLPIRDGLNPTRLRLPPADAPTVLAYLVQRFPEDAARIREKVEAGEVVDQSGTPINAQTPYQTAGFVYLYRDPPVEQRIPFEVTVLHRDENLLVVDKPHFLPTTPRGGFVAETALVRLRRQFDLPELSPAHRLDRLTAGVLLFTVRPDVRRAYQTLFAERRVRKVYEAIGGVDPALGFPRTVRSRIVKHRGVLQAQEVPGAPNSETVIELLDGRGDHARYRLIPRTGKTHQLRVHLNSLGIGILGDPLYPVVRDVAPDDYSNPLRLLARSLEFTDPYSGQRRVFESERTL
ncbi:pseudouridine synthase [Skermania sp. ID1734]|uniref:RluA family pseudouridine synthase n=1 Tax=Skermania sp. ID1734 TaxID=2597516 RepID=UPI0011803E85|nr:RluA family pseudouridine synthase [Skermania sp. ID1734]TSD96672.1 pseudouridine synthase [Skermania sp. ID1734]